MQPNKILAHVLMIAIAFGVFAPFSAKATDLKPTFNAGVDDGYCIASGVSLVDGLFHKYSSNVKFGDGSSANFWLGVDEGNPFEFDIDLAKWWKLNADGRWKLKTEISMFFFRPFNDVNGGDVFSPELRLQYAISDRTYAYGAAEGIFFLGDGPGNGIVAYLGVGTTQNVWRSLDLFFDGRVGYDAAAGRSRSYFKLVATPTIKISSTTTLAFSGATLWVNPDNTEVVWNILQVSHTF